MDGSAHKDINVSVGRLLGGFARGADVDVMLREDGNVF